MRITIDSNKNSRLSVTYINIPNDKEDNGININPKVINFCLLDAELNLYTKSGKIRHVNSQKKNGKEYWETLRPFIVASDVYNNGCTA